MPRFCYSWAGCGLGVLATIAAGDPVLHHLTLQPSLKFTTTTTTNIPTTAIIIAPQNDLDLTIHPLTLKPSLKFTTAISTNIFTTTSIIAPKNEGLLHPIWFPAWLLYCAVLEIAGFQKVSRVYQCVQYHRQAPLWRANPENEEAQLWKTSGEVWSVSKNTNKVASFNRTLYIPLKARPYHRPSLLLCIYTDTLSCRWENYLMRTIPSIIRRACIWQEYL